MKIRYIGGSRRIRLELPTGPITCTKGGEPFEVPDDIGKALVKGKNFEAAGSKKTTAKAPTGKEA